MAAQAEHEEVLRFEDNRLMGKGLGCIDVHLSASVALSEAAMGTRNSGEVFHSIMSLARDKFPLPHK